MLYSLLKFKPIILRKIITSNLLSILLCFVVNFCYAQSDTSNIRRQFNLKLFVNDSTFYQALMKQTSYVIDNKMVQIFPGETLYIEAEIAKDSLVNLHIVPAIIHKDKTIIISFTQDHENNIHKQMILKINNPFSESLVYDAHINLMKTKRWVRTSILPVQPNLVGIEIWSDIITSMVLSDFYLQK